ncbi:O-methyltransferase-domain-containing protein [Xylaria bambusicola]|uniref:O-methyltransferase-domain-containing protein n=1 Tax=Xylaria bambusicola TaxID=326684 RepID=UPI0020088A1E|nr:O-methyltransferase-domain-containing protein [Xylaria bambusicola]KAI0521163.1 O-methyltransferase-domain-containing protein [Xylaria bambusicola]
MQNVILDATSELHDLLLSPMALLIQEVTLNKLLPFQVISHLGIADMVPIGGQISFQEIAAKTGLSEVNVRRILRYAMAMRTFCEPEPEMVAHTNISKAITDPNVRDFLVMSAREVWPASVKTFDAMQKWPKSEELNETAFSLAHNTPLSLYEFFHASPDRALRFSGAMKALTAHPEYDIRHGIDNYAWSSLGKAKVVDIGGNRGNVAIYLARRFPELEIVVQDKQEVIQGAADDVPADLKGRVTFAAHDMFAPQTVQADVYHIRWVMRNWSDKYCIIILRALIPALKPNARIVIQETCMPEPGAVPLWKEKEIRHADLIMTSLFNGRDRSVEDWRAFFSKADNRFILKSAIQMKNSALTILDLRWDIEA